MPVVVAISCDRRDAGPVSPSQRVRPARPEVFISEHLVERVLQSGGLPILLPPISEAGLLQWLVKSVDAVIISGGAFDIHPSHYGQAQVTRLDRIEDERTTLELDLARCCIHNLIPVLGICGGMQVMAVATGGSLIQDIFTQISNSLEHEQPSDPSKPWHRVTLKTREIKEIYQREIIEVNSTHHQAVCDPGIFSIAGIAEDGVIEAIQYNAHPFCYGVQWHPELLDGFLFDALVSAAESKG